MNEPAGELHARLLIDGRWTDGVDTCAVLDNGTVKCWGYAGWGGLGYGNENNLGDQAGEMGDALPAVNLGALPRIGTDFIDGIGMARDDGQEGMLIDPNLARFPVLRRGPGHVGSHIM